VCALLHSVTETHVESTFDHPHYANNVIHIACNIRNQCVVQHCWHIQMITSLFSRYNVM
jgi:hypothetical protein